MWDMQVTEFRVKVDYCSEITVCSQCIKLGVVLSSTPTKIL